MKEQKLNWLQKLCDRFRSPYQICVKRGHIEAFKDFYYDEDWGRYMFYGKYCKRCKKSLSHQA